MTGEGNAIQVVAGRAMSLNIKFTDEFGTQDTTITDGTPCTLAAINDSTTIIKTGTLHSSDASSGWSVQFSLSSADTAVPTGRYVADVKVADPVAGTMQSERFWIEVISPVAS